MAEFTLQAWQDALTKLYARATIDADFRRKCLVTPHDAIKELVPDLELPSSLKVVFLDNATDILQPCVLPPLLQADHTRALSGTAEAMAAWHAHFHPLSHFCCTGGTQTIFTILTR
ncbi:MAG: hypothetical protein INR62_01325 [Rhodospirillales bacterium]|nr:hypothetical protein [Acetobacter sp.]